MLTQQHQHQQFRVQVIETVMNGIEFKPDSSRRNRRCDSCDAICATGCFALSSDEKKHPINLCRVCVPNWKKFLAEYNKKNNSEFDPKSNEESSVKAFNDQHNWSLYELLYTMAMNPTHNFAQDAKDRLGTMESNKRNMIIETAFNGTKYEKYNENQRFGDSTCCDGCRKRLKTEYSIALSLDKDLHSVDLCDFCCGFIKFVNNHDKNFDIQIMRAALQCREFQNQQREYFAGHTKKYYPSEETKRMLVEKLNNNSHGMNNVIKLLKTILNESCNSIDDDEMDPEKLKEQQTMLREIIDSKDPVKLIDYLIGMFITEIHFTSESTSDYIAKRIDEIIKNGDN